MNLDDLFYDPNSEDHAYDIPEEKAKSGKAPTANIIRCACGSLVNIVKPCKCDKCGDYKCYWQMMDGTIKRLEDMDLGHLTNTVKMLSKKLKVDGPKLTAMWRASMELAIDLFYVEIGSRDAEITQAQGIHNALKRSLASKKPEEA